MTASVVEVAEVNVTTNATTATVTLAQTPQAGDLVLVLASFGNTTGAMTAAGLGAAWDTKAYITQAGWPGGNAVTQSVIVGKGATASGAITLTWGTGRQGTIKAFLVRGTTADVAITTRSAASATAFSSASMEGGPDQVVFGLWGTTNTATTPVFPATGTAPSTGWVTQTNYRNLTWGNFNTAYRVPGADATHQLAATTAAAATGFLTEVVLGIANSAPINAGTIAGVVEVGNGQAFGGSAGTTVTLPVTPQLGDVVVAVLNTYTETGSSSPSIAGAGATWALAYSAKESSVSNGAHYFFIGTGATGNTFTISSASFLYGTLRAYVLRGLSDVTLAGSGSNVTASAASSITGPLASVGNGQVVLAAAFTQDNTPSYGETTPTSGWDRNVNPVNSAYGAFLTLARAPGNTKDHQVTLWAAASTKLLRVSQVVIGTAVGGTPVKTTTGTAGVGASSDGAAVMVAAATGSGGVSVGSDGVAGVTSAKVTGQGGAAVGSTAEAQVVGGPVAATGMGGVAVGSDGSAVPVQAAGAHLEPWSADLSQRTRLVLRSAGSIDSMPPLELPPDGFTERPLMRKSLTVPALTSMANVVGGQAVSSPDYAALEDAATVEEVGVPHVIIGGHDVTYFRGVPTQIGSFRCEEPFGDLSASVVFPQVTSMDDEPDDSNVHPFNWSRIRANVQFVLRRPDGTKTRLWSGHVVSHDVNGDVLTLSCQGSLWQASTDVHKVPTMLDPTDIGTLITKALNGVASRRYPRLAAPRTGIMSRQRGSWSDSPLAYVQNLLATAWTASGRQWTVAKVPNTWRTYEMRLKKATPQWTVTNGARGVQADLSRDGVTVRNVVYGHGVGKDGYAWWNYHYPNLRQDDAPAYPYSSAGTVMSVGSTDAGTTSGEGVSVWQARARDLGYNVTVNGVFSSDDASAARAIQRRYGLQVDGVVGPQTWAGTFDVGGNGGDLTGAIRLPLAADPRTQEWLFNADGSVAGENPEYDPNHLIYADDVDFGSGVSREQGIESAQQIVDRESDPGWTGRITLRADPREGSRFLIAAGDKITLVGFRGADRVLHITAAEYDLQGLTVTLDVDEKSRDAMTLAQIRDRNKESRKDPARRPGNVNRRSRLDVDSVVPFDGESGAGWIPKHALYGGLWTVIRVPVSELGRVAKLDIRTSGPASRFAVALFGAPIQPEHLVRYVGDPLASDSPFEAHAAVLEDRFGFIEGWGQKGQAAGYWPGQEGKPLTGRLVDTGGFEYVSAKPPWVWVAEFSATSTFIQGRILPAPIQ